MGEWICSSKHPLTPGKRVPFTYWIGGGVGPRSGHDTVGTRKIPALVENRTPVIHFVALSLCLLSLIAGGNC